MPTTSQGLRYPADTDLVTDVPLYMQQLAEDVDAELVERDTALADEVAARIAAVSARIAAALVDAKGDLIVGTAPDVVARKAVGADGLALLADSTQTDGLRWGTPSASTPLLARKQYAPATAVTYSTTATAGQVVTLDATNLAVTFLAPATGAVVVRLTGHVPASNDMRWLLTDASGGAVVGVHGSTLVGGSRLTASWAQLITGLTPGQSYTWRWAAVSSLAAVSGALTAHGHTGTSQGGPALMEVLSA